MPRKAVRECQFYPMSGIAEGPFLGVSIIAIVISIRATDFGRCMEVVRQSEGPLWDVPLYSQLVIL